MPKGHSEIPERGQGTLEREHEDGHFPAPLPRADPLEDDGKEAEDEKAQPEHYVGKLSDAPIAAIQQTRRGKG